MCTNLAESCGIDCGPGGTGGVGGKDLMPPEATISVGDAADTPPSYEGLDPDEVDRTGPLHGQRARVANSDQVNVEVLILRGGEIVVGGNQADGPEREVGSQQSDAVGPGAS